MAGNFSHILNRGVEKRKIFLNQNDYFRFINNLRDFNDKNNVPLSYFNRKLYGSRTSVGFAAGYRRKVAGEDKDNKLVDILCWSLLPNHFHILVREKIDKGSGAFVKKLTGGYTLYFNLVNKRSGVLFQGRSKIIPVEKDVHFSYLPFYILSNPIDIIDPRWKEEGIKDLSKTIEFLKNYRYSSFQDIIGKNNFPAIINKDLFYEAFGTNEKKFQKDFFDWLESYAGGKFEEFSD